MALPPVTIDTESGLTESAVNAGGGADTITIADVDRCVVANPVPLPVAVTVIVALPGLTAVTTPLVFTEAIASPLDVYAYCTVTPAPAVIAVGVKAALAPVSRPRLSGTTVSSPSAGGGVVTVTGTVA